MISGITIGVHFWGIIKFPGLILKHDYPSTLRRKIYEDEFWAAVKLTTDNGNTLGYYSVFIS